jgi:histidinol dehydrogenase
MARRMDTHARDFEREFAGLMVRREAEADSVGPAVEAIIADIRARGDRALIEYTERFDRHRPHALRLSDAEIDGAIARADAAAVAALRFAAARIEEYHRRQLPEDSDFRDAAGVRLGWRWSAVDSAGLYVPGGRAAYPSSVLMNALPAKIAGVARIAMTVPTPDGELAPLVLAAARIAGVGEIYRVGGAQAIAALAYGTETIRPVDCIVGPGNAYVAAAKRRVFGRVGIDSIAGPSEVVIVADKDTDPEWIAADLMAQAEHDENAQSILITDDAGFADAVAQAVERLLETLPRAAIAGESWRRNGAIIVAGRLDEAPPLIDCIAPEHVQLAVKDPEVLLARIRHAGAIFLGRMTPEAVGDYVGGPNHVLPTSGAARHSSGLSVLTFMKRTSILECRGPSLEAIGPAARTLAQAEGLHAHARSIETRLKR